VHSSIPAILLFLVWALSPEWGWADAIVRTQAMFATTIAEFHLERGDSTGATGEDARVRLELELGAADLSAFADLLPDELYEKLGREPEPWAERLDRFFREGLVLRGEDGQPLPGRLVSMEPRERLRRDEITGEVLSLKAGEEPETVIFAELLWTLAGSPRTLDPGGPAGASVGFVFYHEGIPVNDFRYLAGSQLLDIDWEDPWYTSFRARSLRRTYDAPMSGFLYVDPYEVRKEIIARPLDLQQWVDLGLEGRDTIPAEIQPELERRAAAFLREHHPVVIDGKRLEPELARVNFLERTLKTSRVVEPRRELDVHSAILGVIFVYPTGALPQRATLEWDLWSDRIQRVPAASVDQAGPLPSILEPDYRVLEWQNFLKNPEIPGLEILAAPPGAVRRALAWLRWALLAVAVGAVLWSVRAPRRRVPVALAGLGIAAAAFWWGRDAVLTDARARQVVGGLLRNVYHAFDFRDEGHIYDVLARSVEGELLEQIYLETRRGLELANQGGARARVKAVEVDELETRSDGRGFAAEAVWSVGGAVGHWGHVHERRNRYRAELRVAPVDGDWKLVGLEILEEERL